MNRFCVTIGWVAMGSMVLVACGEPEVVAPSEVATEGVSSGEELETPTDDPRVLAGGTFADLVSAARALDGRSDARTYGCLLRPPMAGRGWVLEGEVAVSVRPLPEPPISVTAGLDTRGSSVRGLSRWGQRGSGQLTLLAFTPTPPTRGLEAVVFVAAEGTRIRLIGQDVSAEYARAVPNDQVGAALGALQVRSAWVTADAGMALSEVAELLRTVHVPVAFAVPLPDGVTLPPAPTTTAATDLCPDGLTPPAGEAAIPVADVVEALQPFRDSAGECLAAGSVESAAGGRIEVSFHVGPDGAVSQACAMADATGSEPVRACVLEALRSVRFPAPDPAGTVAFALPVQLAPANDPAPHPLCADDE